MAQILLNVVYKQRGPMFCIYDQSIEKTCKKEVLYRRDSSQVGGFKVLPTLKRGGREQPVKAG